MHVCNMYVCVYSCMRACVACNCNLACWATGLLYCSHVCVCGRVWSGQLGWMGLDGSLLLLLLFIWESMGCFVAGCNVRVRGMGGVGTTG